MNSLITLARRAALCGLSVEALKRDGVNKRYNASMDKSFDGMQEKYDFDSIRCSVKKTISISISIIVTSVVSGEFMSIVFLCSLMLLTCVDSNCVKTVLTV